MQYENQTVINNSLIVEARRQLQEDAACAANGNNEKVTQKWIDPLLWGQYMGKTAEGLYNSFTDQELLDMLRDKAKELGRNPGQREIFCVYRMYIRRRFKNWPTALRAAGLKSSKKKEGDRL